MVKTFKFWFVLLLLLLPTFVLMLRPGIYTMHDPHLFRVFEFNKCIQDGVFPCRWAPDSGKGYGEPLFNFYTQFPYWLTQIFIFSGLSLIDSTKAVFIFSIVASAFAMFLLSRRFFGNSGGFLSSLFYIYAPYRSVDVWVRGALPEALAFVMYPLILLFLDQYLVSRKTLPLVLFSFSLAILITTHNLSFLMFAPFLFLFWLYRSITLKNLSNLLGLIPAGIFALLLSAYYLLPIILESHLVTLSQTTTGYYDYHIHFATLNELLISRFWGYGASLWARKYLSISVGQLQWTVPIFLSLVWAIKHKLKLNSYSLLFFFTVFLGVLALFLTHGKSSFIWNHLPFMKFIQFPWRFVGVAIFFLSLSVGFMGKVLPFRPVIAVFGLAVIAANFMFFKPDIWRSITDKQEYSGALWDEGRSSSLGDFWPQSARSLPTNFAPSQPEFILGSGTIVPTSQKSDSQSYLVDVDSVVSQVKFPTVYFPGWVLLTDGRPTPIFLSGDQGAIAARLSQGPHSLSLTFTDTFARRLGNSLSLASLLFITPIWFLKKKLG